MHHLWVSIHKTHQTSLWGGGLGELSATWGPKIPSWALQHAPAEAHQPNLPPRRGQATPHTYPAARTHTTHHSDTYLTPHTLAPPLSLLSCNLPPSHTARHTLISNQSRHTSTPTLAARAPSTPQSKTNYRTHITHRTHHSQHTCGGLERRSRCADASPQTSIRTCNHA